MDLSLEKSLQGAGLGKGDMEDKLLPMQQVPPPCHWCNPREGQEFKRLGTSAMSCQDDVEVND